MAESKSDLRDKENGSKRDIVLKKAATNNKDGQLKKKNQRGLQGSFRTMKAS